MAGITGSPNGINFTISAPGVNTFSASFERFGTAVGDFRPFWSGAFAARWRQHMLDTFRSEGASTGDTWPRLSAPYATWKAKRFGGQGILVRRGSLSASLINAGSGGMTGVSVFQPEARGLLIGTSVPYAMFHQKGTRKMPARPVMRFTREFARTISNDLQTFVSAAWAERRKQLATGA